MSAQAELPPGWNMSNEPNSPFWFHAAGPLGQWTRPCEHRTTAAGIAWGRFGITREEYTTMRAAVVELEALKKTVSHIHKTVGGCRLPLTGCNEDTCEAQRAVTEVHCATMNAGWPE